MFQDAQTNLPIHSGESFKRMGEEPSKVSQQSTPPDRKFENLPSVLTVIFWDSKNRHSQNAISLRFQKEGHSHTQFNIGKMWCILFQRTNSHNWVILIKIQVHLCWWALYSHD